MKSNTKQVNNHLQYFYAKYLTTVKAALHIERFESAGTATKIDSFRSDRKRLRRELHMFLLPKHPKVGRLRSDSSPTFHEMCMLLYGRIACALKTLDMESSLYANIFLKMPITALKLLSRCLFLQASAVF